MIINFYNLRNFDNYGGYLSWLLTLSPETYSACFSCALVLCNKDKKIHFPDNPSEELLNSGRLSPVQYIRFYAFGGKYPILYEESELLSSIYYDN